MPPFGELILWVACSTKTLLSTRIKAFHIFPHTVASNVVFRQKYVLSEKDCLCPVIKIVHKYLMPQNILYHLPTIQTYLKHIVFHLKWDWSCTLIIKQPLSWRALAVSTSGIVLVELQKETSVTLSILLMLKALFCNIIPTALVLFSIALEMTKESQPYNRIVTQMYQKVWLCWKLGCSGFSTGAEVSRVLFRQNLEPKSLKSDTWLKENIPYTWSEGWGWQ